MLKSCLSVLLAATVLCPLALAQDHRVEVLKEAAPADAISKEVAATLAPQGFSIYRGKTRKVCDVWVCKTWKVKSAKAGKELLYPFAPGQLIGVIRYPRRGHDFRDAQVSKGVYTMRYGQQPVDGNHIGTSPTRDFLMLIDAGKDRGVAALNLMKAVEGSSEAADTGHPAILSLQKPGSRAKKGTPMLRHDEEHDWWIVQVDGTLGLGDKKQPTHLDLVVVGHAAE